MSIGVQSAAPGAVVQPKAGLIVAMLM